MKWVRVLVVVSLLFSINGCSRKKGKKQSLKHEDVVQPLDIKPDAGSDE